MPKPQKNQAMRPLLWIGIPALLAVIFSGYLIYIGSQNPAERNADPNSRQLIFARESLYNNIYIYRQGPYVSMTFGFNRKIYTESIFNTKDELDLPVAYTRYMTAGLIYPKNIHSILEIGFGGGRTAWYLHKYLPDVPVTSVELDPAIVKLAHQYFGIEDEPNFKVATEDGRKFLTNSKDRYDMILVDAYRGPFVPFHLLTKEFYQTVKDHLADGGVVAQNVEPSTMLFDSAVATIRSVFPNVDFYLADGNVVTIAYDGTGKTPDELAAMAKQRQGELKLRYDLTQLLAQRRPFAADKISGDAKILTDDFAPVETLKAIESHNRKWTEQ